jgi:hypothetical protein
VPKACRVLAVDVGSVRGKFAWAALDLPNETYADAGDHPESAVKSLVAALGTGLPTALGFEAPLSIPVPQPGPQAWADLGRARAGEGSRSWSAGAGTGALATGLAEMAWIIGRLHTVLGQISVTTSATAWLAGRADLFIWEAFVSGPGKPPPGAVGQHAADAAVAAQTFADRHRHEQLLLSDVDCAPYGALNLAWAAARRGGLLIDDAEADATPSVYKTPPAA